MGTARWPRGDVLSALCLAGHSPFTGDIRHPHTPLRSACPAPPVLDSLLLPAAGHLTGGAGTPPPRPVALGTPCLKEQCHCACKRSHTHTPNRQGGELQAHSRLTMPGVPLLHEHPFSPLPLVTGAASIGATPGTTGLGDNLGQQVRRLPESQLLVCKAGQDQEARGRHAGGRRATGRTRALKKMPFTPPIQASQLWDTPALGLSMGT